MTSVCRLGWTPVTQLPRSFVISGRQEEERRKKRKRKNDKSKEEEIWSRENREGERISDTEKKCRRGKGRKTRRRKKNVCIRKKTKVIDSNKKGNRKNRRRRKIYETKNAKEIDNDNNKKQHPLIRQETRDRTNK